jgi:hypothetical protein
MGVQMSKPKVTADQLKELLAQKHASDVFVPECKDGPSQGTWHYRLDAWAMNRSWASPVTWGYEVKVSRSDFLKDDKWQAYLPCCSEFYFVCPPDLIKPEEVPSEAGILWSASTGTRLFVKKKAPRRQVEIPESLYRYILMCRTSVVRWVEPSRADEWRKWLDEKIENRRLGYNVSKSVRETVEHQIEAVRHENRELKARCESLEEIRECIKAVGLDPKEFAYKYDFKRQVKAIESLIDPRDEQLLRDLNQSVSKILGQIESSRQREVVNVED